MLPRGSQLLVTGGTGFLGRAFLKQLVGRYRVVALARAPDAAPSIDGVDWIPGDLRQPLARARLPRRVAAVVHLASLREPSSDAGAEQLFAVNVGSTAALLEYAVGAGARRFIYGSTGGVYGYRSGRIRESHKPAPFDLYTLSKWHGETVVARELRLSSVVVRYFFPYGPGQRAGIVPRLANTIASGRSVTLYRRGRVPHINPVFVDDAADLTCRALLASTTLVVNCAGRDIVTVRDLSHRVAAVLGVRPVFVQGRDPKVGDMVASLSQSARALGFTPGVSLDTGLERTLRVTA
jgi:UDP-glucose 4-epimerase